MKFSIPNVIMTFSSFQFKEGTNLTVRRGTAWGSRLTVGEQFRLLEKNGDQAAWGVVIGKKVQRACDIRTYDLEFEHDPKARTHRGLYASLREAYNDESFEPKEIVTLIFFQVLP